MLIQGPFAGRVGVGTLGWMAGLHGKETCALSVMGRDKSSGTSQLLTYNIKGTEE